MAWGMRGRRISRADAREILKETLIKLSRAISVTKFSGSYEGASPLVQLILNEDAFGAVAGWRRLSSQQETGEPHLEVRPLTSGIRNVSVRIPFA
jgi:hypothetical protein